jgi:hypothetical protein
MLRATNAATAMTTTAATIPIFTPTDLFIFHLPLAADSPCRQV